MYAIQSLLRASAGVALAMVLVGAPLAVQAADNSKKPATALPAVDAKAVLARGEAGDITAAQLDAAVQALVPPAEREVFWASKDSVIRFLRSLGAQQALAARAARAGMQPADPQATGLAREQALFKAYLEQQAKAAVPDDAALDRYTASEFRAHPERFVEPAQVRVRHILLAVDKDGANDAAVKAHADKLLAQLRAGADFAALAKAESIDKGSAQRGGELPAFGRGRMVAEFEAAAFGLKQPGALSAPVKSQFGYHIIELLEAKPERKLAYEDVRLALRAQAQERFDAAERARLWAEAQAQVKVDEDLLLPLMYRNAAAAAAKR